MRVNDAWKVIDEVYRPSTDVACLERALKPISLHVSAIVPDVETLVKAREETVVDYDSYRRRLKAKEGERDAAEAERINAEAQGKASKSTDAIKSEVIKFEQKVSTKEHLLAEQTANIRTRLRDAEHTHKQLLYDVLLTSIVVQEDLFTRSALQLRAVLDAIPPEYREAVDAIRTDLQLKISKAAKEKTLLEKMVPIDGRTWGPSTRSSGDATAGPLFAKPTNPETVHTSAALPAKTNETGFPPSTVAPSTVFVEPIVPPVANRVLTVTALYDNVADSEDELSFTVGDVIEVLDMGDDGSGWGRGRLGFNEGLFPLNFVQHNS
jgi:hypothetical protein